MSLRPYTDLIQKGIAWYKDLEDFGRKSQGGALVTIPGDSKRPYRAWSDPQAVSYSRDFFSGFYNRTGVARTYKFIARDSAGFPRLTQIGSKEFKDTYSQVPNSANYKTYEQYDYMFGGGVPFLEEKTLYGDLDKFEEPNFKGYSPGYDYPLEIKPTDMLLVGASGIVQTVDVYDFLNLVSVRGFSDKEKLEMVRKTYERLDMSDSAKVKAIHEITLRANIVGPVI